MLSAVTLTFLTAKQFFFRQSSASVSTASSHLLLRIILLLILALHCVTHAGRIYISNCSPVEIDKTK